MAAEFVLFPYFPEKKLKALARAQTCGWIFCGMRFANWKADCVIFVEAVQSNTHITPPCPWPFCFMAVKALKDQITPTRRTHDHRHK